LECLDAISESNAILSAILAVIYSKHYDASWQTAKCLKDTPEIGPQDVLSQWASFFSSIAIIFNHSTLSHWDRSSRCHWYDMLATFEKYQNCKLELPSLRISLEYGLGTMLGYALECLVSERSHKPVSTFHLSIYFKRNKTVVLLGIADKGI
jgi:hypothetical protein